jgi:NADH-quinone oxidoreductase subunit I
VEACPTDAITHGHGFELSSYNTSTLIFRKEHMLAPVPPGASGKIQVEEQDQKLAPAH